MDYIELVRRLRECTAEQNGEKTLWHQAADAIEELEKKMLNWQATADDHWDAYHHWFDKYNELLKAAKKMHTWIFLHTGDEQKAYDECGLSEDMNIALGYSGQIEFRAKKPEEDRGCPPDYNPGFCYGDEDCDACWEGWRKEQEEP